MDVRNVFRAVGEELSASFRKSAEIKHNTGKGSAREDAIRGFLQDYLPTKYSVGQGEIISSANMTSGQLDVVIFDATQCPVFKIAEDHNVFPSECVYGAISIKSHLDSTELADAYRNIVSAKSLMPRDSWVFHPHPAMAIGLPSPYIVTGIVAYSANRSLDAIRDQLLELDRQQGDRSVGPDFVSVLDRGIVVSEEPLRGEFNKYTIPDADNVYRLVKKTGRHTLLKTYMHVLREINALTLRTFDLADYERMPSLVGDHRVTRHNRFVRHGEDGEFIGVYRLNKSCIQRIVKDSVRTDHRGYFMAMLGTIPEIQGDPDYDFDAPAYLYNPLRRRPINALPSKIVDGKTHLPDEVFRPEYLVIDGLPYYYDVSALSEGDFEENSDTTVDELFAL